MIVLAAGVLAIGTNAASINWTATKGYLYDGDGDSSAKITSGTAYLVLSTYGQSDLVSLFASNDGNAAATLTTLQGKAQYLGSGAIGDNARVAEGSGTTSSTDSITAYFVVFNDDKMYVSANASSEYDSLTSEHSINFASISTSSKLSFDAASGYSAAGWYGAAAVPEPTSGLLMLLGMALALPSVASARKATISQETEKPPSHRGRLLCCE